MASCLNLLSLLISSLGFSLFYGLSVSPARLARTKGEKAYRLAARYRLICSVCMSIAFINFILYRILPVSSDPLSPTFPWPYPISVAVAAALALPAGMLLVSALKAAGKVTLVPKKEHDLYRGIYEKIRHPQAIGELAFWYVTALLLDTPFLILVAVLYTPIWIVWCFLKEWDLSIRYGEEYLRYQARTGMFIPKRKHGGSPSNTGSDRKHRT